MIGPWFILMLQILQICGATQLDDLPGEIVQELDSMWLETKKGECIA